jgi:hypothetical protein
MPPLPLQHKLTPCKACGSAIFTKELRYIARKHTTSKNIIRFHELEYHAPKVGTGSLKRGILTRGAVQKTA